MTTQLTPRSSRKTFRSALSHDVAMRLATTEYDRVASTLEQLEPEHWSRSTDCEAWDVRAVVGHMVGMARFAGSTRELVRQFVLATWRARRQGLEPIDGLTGLQVDEHASLTTADLPVRMRQYGTRAARYRDRMPASVRRHVTLSEETGGVQERWTMGYLVDTILTRDPFMHRLDIARATGVLVPATAEHEGVIVDDVVREWASRHGQPFSLELTGAAGGRWGVGTGGEAIAMDAADFCRVVSGRGSGPGLLGSQVPF